MADYAVKFNQNGKIITDKINIITIVITSAISVIPLFSKLLVCVCMYSRKVFSIFIFFICLSSNYKYISNVEQILHNSLYLRIQYIILIIFFQYLHKL